MAAFKRHAYDAEFKLKAVGHAVEYGNRAAAREFNINESMVRKWRKQEDDLRQVTVNGQDLHVFNYRIPVESVNALQIGGDVSIQTITVIGGGYPAGDEIGSNLPVMDGQPIYNPPVPYSLMIPGGMCPKKTIVIRGMVPLGANRFSINFMVGGSRDIVFHINPRLQEGEVVRNSLIGGSWETEEREISINPFQEGQYFDMSIRCGNQRFKVFVNGQHFCDFSHRFQNFSEIDTLELEGDVQISYVHF
ncbi:hypothetical protein J4Q44_G00340040 [Coregonus suidteri]|uniref:Galectin n=1 Tax=Coregonus suidteri TaxID=861788 RepID=A0AAN8L0Q8_9TELE